MRHQGFLLSLSVVLLCTLLPTPARADCTEMPDLDDPVFHEYEATVRPFSDVFTLMVHEDFLDPQDGW